MNDDEQLDDGLTNDDAIRLTTDIITAYVSRNAMGPEGLAELIKNVYGALNDAAAPEPEPEVLKPAVPISKSVTDDYIICLEDGKKLTMLKRYLRSQYDLSPEDYRKRWNLPSTYPMVAPNYAKRRSEFAKKIGLGRANAKA
ncbi:MAG: MucR family transcriptional regulator [Maricaulaceae bacterium]